jgi:hypothetical protein
MLTLLEHSLSGSGQLAVDIDTLVIAGWTGRDASAVAHHVRELEALGVRPPRATPLFYRVAAANLSTASSIQVAGTASSGEVEFVLIQGPRHLWIGVGSDHTDRALEKHSVTLSKQVCAKPLAAEVWRFEELEAHWDSLELRSIAEIRGERRIYQHGSVAAIRTPLDLIRRYCESDRLPAHTAMFCGTLPVPGGIEPADRLALELHDPVLHRSLRHEYEIVSLPADD